MSDTKIASYKNVEPSQLAKVFGKKQAQCLTKMGENTMYMPVKEYTNLTIPVQYVTTLEKTSYMPMQMPVKYSEVKIAPQSQQLGTGVCSSQSATESQYARPQQYAPPPQQYGSSYQEATCNGANAYRQAGLDGSYPPPAPPVQSYAYGSSAAYYNTMPQGPLVNQHVYAPYSTNTPIGVYPLNPVPNDQIGVYPLNPVQNAPY